MLLEGQGGTGRGSGARAGAGSRDHLSPSRGRQPGALGVSLWALDAEVHTSLQQVQSEVITAAGSDAQKHF